MSIAVNDEISVNVYRHNDRYLHGSGHFSRPKKEEEAEELCSDRRSL